MFTVILEDRKGFTKTEVVSVLPPILRYPLAAKLVATWQETDFFAPLEYIEFYSVGRHEDLEHEGDNPVFLYKEKR